MTLFETALNLDAHVNFCLLQVVDSWYLISLSVVTDI